jgi:hypothetical protein
VTPAKGVRANLKLDAGGGFRCDSDKEVAGTVLFRELQPHPDIKVESARSAAKFFLSKPFFFGRQLVVVGENPIQIHIRKLAASNGGVNGTE